MTILEVYIISMTSYDHDKYFSIAGWEKSGVSCDTKVKEKLQKKNGNRCFVFIKITITLLRRYRYFIKKHNVSLH